jgi:SPP1 family predicted phage head-tail adaptor
MSLSAGKLKHVVSIQERQEVVDQDGEREHSWVTVFPRLYADVQPLSVRELVASQAETSKLSARVTVRFRTGINSGQRLLFRGQVYNIEGAQPDPESGLEWLTLAVSTGTRDQNA